MTRENTVRSMPSPALAEKSRELAHREPTLSQPNWFQVNRRLKEIEAQQQRTEEMLSTMFLVLEDIRVAVGATGEEPISGLGFRLPEARLEAPEVSMPWWQRAWYSFVDPSKLRRPGADRWSSAGLPPVQAEVWGEGEHPVEEIDATCEDIAEGDEAFDDVVEGEEVLEADEGPERS